MQIFNLESIMDKETFCVFIYFKQDLVFKHKQINTNQHKLTVDSQQNNQNLLNIPV